MFKILPMYKALKMNKKLAKKLFKITILRFFKTHGTDT